MARRGEALRTHILWTAKHVFLELGFERTSMDEVSLRAKTSKRSLYAHFASKERLFLAVIDLVRDLIGDRLQSPDHYGAQPAAALTAFCARYLESMLYEPAVQLVRVTTAEAARFPEAAARLYQATFGDVADQLAVYLRARFALAPRASTDAAHRLLAQVLHPRFPRALFGLDELASEFGAQRVDARAIRRAVDELLDQLQLSPRRSASRRP